MVEKRILHKEEDAKAYVRDAGQKTKQNSGEVVQSMSTFLKYNSLIYIYLLFNKTEL